MSFACASPRWSHVPANRLTIILNTGCANAPAIAERLDETCRAAGAGACVVRAAGPAIARAARRAVEEGATTIAAAGGDGTVSTVAAIVAGSRARLGVIPLGTLNHFARDLGIPLDPVDAVAVAIHGPTRQVDVGEVNGRLFVNNSSVGLYPRLVWERQQLQRRGRHKWHAMMAAAITVWRHYRRVKVAIEHDGDGGRVVRTPFVFVGNNEYQLSGLDFGARTALDAGRLHVCMAPGLSAAGVMRVLTAVLLGRLVSFEQFESLRTAALTIRAARPRLGVSLDGELTVMATPLRYRIRPQALRVAVP